MVKITITTVKTVLRFLSILKREDNTQNPMMVKNPTRIDSTLVKKRAVEGVESIDIKGTNNQDSRGL
jgi:hypothetical protein